MNSRQAEVVVNVLVRLHNDAKLYGIVSDDYLRCAYAIKKILYKVKADFDSETMVNIVKITIDKLGETLKPLDYTILKEMIQAGFVVTKVNKISRYDKKKK